jgi:hypothetical protein
LGSTVKRSFQQLLQQTWTSDVVWIFEWIIGFFTPSYRAGSQVFSVPYYCRFSFDRLIISSFPV